MDTPNLNELREQIAAALTTRNQTAADLARALNKNYTQVYQWLTGKVTPNGEITLLLQNWLKQ